MIIRNATLTTVTTDTDIIDFFYGTR